MAAFASTSTIPHPVHHLHGSRSLTALCAASVLALLLASPASSHATILTVTSADDVLVTNGACTLREAITNVNAAADTTGGDCAAGSGTGDTIAFAIPGAGVHVIAVTQALPTLTRRVRIDGYSQPGSVHNSLAVGTDAVLRIVLSGAQVVATDGLVIATADTVVEGLVIKGFVGGAGIRLLDERATRAWIDGNYIGTDDTGSLAAGNDDGIVAEAGASDNLIGSNGDEDGDEGERNLISSNKQHGVLLTGLDTSGNRIAGNYIGCDGAGTTALGYYFGVTITSGAHDNVIGTNGDGTADAAERNVISGTGQGVEISYGAHANHVAGNYVGIDPTGAFAIENGTGIIINGFDNIIGTNGDGIADASERNVIAGNLNEGVDLTGFATGNRIAGNYIGLDPSGTRTYPHPFRMQEGILLNSSNQNLIGTNGDGVADEAERNVIAGNGSGILLNHSNANRIAGNFIGTDQSGLSALPNVGGLEIQVSDDNLIGTNEDGISDELERNVIAGSTLHGIDLAFGSSNNRIVGNRIGTNADGDQPLPNDVGVLLRVGAAHNLVGGTSAGTSGNLIAWNTHQGVVVAANPAPQTAGNRILGNSIVANGALGIDLGDDGPTANDELVGDADGGPNALQNFPTFHVVNAAAVGTLDSTPLTAFRVEFFDNPTCDDSAPGQGGALLTAIEVTTDSAGLASFATPIGNAEHVTATATNLATGDTSEFSACQTAAPAYQCYDAHARGFDGVSGVTLRDRFGPSTVDLPDIRRICNSVALNADTTTTPPSRFLAYRIDRRRPHRKIPAPIEIVDRFGALTLHLTRPDILLVPATANLTEAPPVSPTGEHFTCYQVRNARYRMSGLLIGDELARFTVNVLQPLRLCVPTDKNGENPSADTRAGALMCYEVRPTAASRPVRAVKGIPFADQFGTGLLSRHRPTELCVSATVS